MVPDYKYLIIPLSSNYSYTKNLNLYKIKYVVPGFKLLHYVAKWPIKCHKLDFRLNKFCCSNIQYIYVILYIMFYSKNVANIEKHLIKPVIIQLK